MWLVFIIVHELNTLSTYEKSMSICSMQDYYRHGQHIGRQIKTISATVENVR